MISDPETEFGLGSAADRLCVLGQVTAFLPQHPHLHKERSEGVSGVSGVSSPRLEFFGQESNHI